MNMDWLNKMLVLSTVVLAVWMLAAWMLSGCPSLRKVAHPAECRNGMEGTDAPGDTHLSVLGGKSPNELMGRIDERLHARNHPGHASIDIGRPK